jgi:hypothetical protein
MVEGAVSAESPGVVSDAIEVNEGATLELDGTTVTAPSGWAIELTGVGGTAAIAVVRNAQFTGGPIGAALLNGNLQAEGSIFEATGAGGRAIHLVTDAPSNLTVKQSSLIGTESVNSVPAPSATVNVATSKLAGTVLRGTTASFTCAASYNGSYIALGGNCL